MTLLDSLNMDATMRENAPGDELWGAGWGGGRDSAADAYAHRGVMMCLCQLLPDRAILQQSHYLHLQGRDPATDR